MYKEIINSKIKEMDESLEHFKQELAKVRTGRANPGLVENIMVDYYGSKSPIKQVASINIPEPRMIVIQPWAIDQLVNIEAAIKAAGLGLNPTNDGRIIRIAIPSLTEERRKELVKFLNKLTEEARISVRNIREKIWKEIQEAENEGLIAEDDRFRAKDELQEVIDDYNKKIEEIQSKKEQEIMTV